MANWTTTEFIVFLYTAAPDILDFPECIGVGPLPVDVAEGERPVRAIECPSERVHGQMVAYSDAGYFVTADYDIALEYAHERNVYII